MRFHLFAVLLLLICATSFCGVRSVYQDLNRHRSTNDQFESCVAQRWNRGAYGRRGYWNNDRPPLPQGRRYYQGRYFGNFNNRFYGPQYGYF